MKRTSPDRDAMHREQRAEPDTLDDLRELADGFTVPEPERIRRVVAAIAADLAAQGWPDPRRMVEIDDDAWRPLDPGARPLRVMLGRAFIEDRAGPLSEDAALARVVEYGQAALDALDTGDAGRVLWAAVRFGIEAERGQLRQAFLGQMEIRRRQLNGSAYGGREAARNHEPIRREIVEFMAARIERNMSQKRAAEFAKREFRLKASADSIARTYRRARK